MADGIAGIDLDHCMENGTLLPLAQKIVDKFRATYIEVSPNGRGIRIFCLVPKQFAYDTATYYIKNGNIEVYIPGHTNRFLTVTGDVLNAADVTETAEALTWLLDTYMGRPTPSTPAVASPGKSYLFDEDVIIKASSARNGEKFNRLWNGDITGYKTQSEADAALTSILAFWCGGDTEQIDRLFRQSCLMRNKWDEYRGADTYGNMTIAKAVANMTTFYQPIIVPAAATEFGMERLKELDSMDTARYPWTDSAQDASSQTTVVPMYHNDYAVSSIATDAEAQWIAEGKQIPEDEEVLNIYRFETHKLSPIAKIHINLLEDESFGFEAWILKRFSHRFARAEAKAFLTGTGEGEPLSIMKLWKNAGLAGMRMWKTLPHSSST